MVDAGPRSAQPGAETPRWALAATAATLACFLVLPHRDPGRVVTHTLADRTSVMRGNEANTLGWPFEWLWMSRPEWTAVLDGHTVGATDAQIAAFVEQESVDWSNFRVHCGLDRSLFALATRAEYRQLERDPRARVVAASWSSLGVDALGGSLVAGCGLRLWGRHSRRRRARRQSEGRCAACGYDLTGNVSGRCPECGESCGAMHRQGDSPT